MKNKKFAPLFAAALIACLCVVSIADTIRLKDGSVIRGQVIGFRDQQFTVLIGSGTRGRRSRITVYMEDVDSIEFDSAGVNTSANIGSDDAVSDNTASNTRPAPTETRPAPVNTTTNRTSSPAPTQPSSTTPTFFQINTRVRADNTNNGWTSTGLMVRRGQRLRITASGRVSLGGGRFSTPTGLPRVSDNDKLMRNEPTGALIGVIGDDNDDFIFIGGRREFVAQRDGMLFLGVNEGDLKDNTGTYDVVIEAEAVSGTTR